MINSIEIFDKGNASSRLTVTADGDVRIKIGKKIKEEDKDTVTEHLTFIANCIVEKGISTTYRKHFMDKELFRNINRRKNTPVA